MKNIFKLLMLLVITLSATSCSDEEVAVETLDIIPANLHGKWKLEELNGAAIPETNYIYLDFHYNGTFKLYQNHDTMNPRYITGTYNLVNNPKIGAVISGAYDFGNGKWNNEYIITDMLKSGSMIWTVRDDKAENKADLEVQKFVRIDEIPQDVLEAGKYDQNED